MGCLDNDSDMPLWWRGSRREDLNLQNMTEQQLTTQTNILKKQKLSVFANVLMFGILRFFYTTVILNICIIIAEVAFVKCHVNVILWNENRIEFLYMIAMCFLSLLLLILTNAFLHIVSYKSYLPRWYEIMMEIILFVISVTIPCQFILTYLTYANTLKLLSAGVLTNAVFTILFTFWLFYIMQNGYRNSKFAPYRNLIRRMSKKRTFAKQCIFGLFCFLAIGTILLCIFIAVRNIILRKEILYNLTSALVRKNYQQSD